ncbi:hypothetical protein [Halalkalibacter urbisdiaboli]|uniref:hypothetical protein n=1 Tax=Halalkalibacter urbisdiaboli TaxID=1960589 RepID=UPI000B4358FA|nr:hypothetical protein [Halalkalibacter urbisdiaboli]
MKKGWLIGGCVTLVLLLVIGSISFQQRVEETSRQTSADKNETYDDSVATDGVEQGEESDAVEEDSAERIENEELENRNRVYAASSEDLNETEENSAANGLSSKSSTSPNTNDGGVKENNQRSLDRDADSKQSTKSVSQIRNEYANSFQQMEFRQNVKIDQLIDEAIRDFIKNGKENIDANKYRNRASQLLAQSDAEFAEQYQKLQKDLRDNGHSGDELVEFKSTYEKRKVEKRQELEISASGL